jgi:hypothetical protein
MLMELLVCASALAEWYLNWPDFILLSRARLSYCTVLCFSTVTAERISTEFVICGWNWGGGGGVDLCWSVVVQYKTYFT